jgi:hypothetical protein
MATKRLGDQYRYKSRVQLICALSARWQAGNIRGQSNCSRSIELAGRASANAGHRAPLDRRRPMTSTPWSQGRARTRPTWPRALRPCRRLRRRAALQFISFALSSLIAWRAPVGAEGGREVSGTGLGRRNGRQSRPSLVSAPRNGTARRKPPTSTGTSHIMSRVHATPRETACDHYPVRLAHNR